METRRTTPADGVRLMVLGASALQVPLVEAAVARGHHVTTVDNVPGNPAHALAHASLDVSTREVDELCRQARAHGVEAVATCASDVAVPAATAIAASLDLPGVDPAVARLFLHKDRFRAFQQRNRLAHPAWVEGDDAIALADAAHRLAGPVVVKPVDRSGSRAVRVLPDAGDEGLLPAIWAALSASFVGRACVESFLPGEELGGDGVVLGGRLRCFFPTRKSMDGCLVRGHRLPAELPGPLARTVHREIQAHVTAAGLDEAIVNADIRIAPSGTVCILEMSPRMGGNGIPQLIAHVHGVDLFGCALDLATAAEPCLAVGAFPHPAATHVLGAASAGIAARCPTTEEIRAEVPELIELSLDLKPGDAFTAFRDSGDQLGRALFDDSHGEAESIARRIEDQVLKRVAT